MILKPYAINKESGLVFIFDNRQDDLTDDEKFDAKDCERLCQLFIENGCNVTYKVSLDFDDIKDAIKNECKNRPKISFIAIFVLTMRGPSSSSDSNTGQNFTRLCSNDRDYNLEELTSFVLDLEPAKLKGVPKLFFIEAGKSHIQFDAETFLMNGVPVSLPRTSDHLINFIQYDHVVDDDSPFLELLFQEMFNNRKLPIQNHLIKIRNKLESGIQMTDSSTLLHPFQWPPMKEIQK